MTDEWRKTESELERHRFSGVPTFEDTSCALASVGEGILRFPVLGWGVCDGRVAENDLELRIPFVHWVTVTGLCHPIELPGS